MIRSAVNEDLFVKFEKSCICLGSYLTAIVQPLSDSYYYSVSNASILQLTEEEFNKKLYGERILIFENLHQNDSMFINKLRLIEYWDNDAFCGMWKTSSQYHKMPNTDEIVEGQVFLEDNKTPLHNFNAISTKKLFINNTEIIFKLGEEIKSPTSKKNKKKNGDNSRLEKKKN